jgi:uncharacterized repeat protein (TIGR02059 family)
MATNNWTGTSAANTIGLATWGEPSKGSTANVYNLNGLDGNDTLVLNDNGKASYNTPFQSSGFTINPVNANGVIVVTGASSGGKSGPFTFNLTSVETLVFADKTVTLNYGSAPPPPPPPPPSDTTAPVFASATVNGSTLVMNYNEALSTAAPAAGAFTVPGHTVTGVAVSGQTVTLTLNSPVANGDVVTVSYADPTTGNDANAIQDTAGNDAATLVSVAVTNNTPAPPPPPAGGDTTAPVFTSAAVNGSTLVMSYTDANNLDAAHAPAAGAFTVSGHAVSGVAVDAAAKTVTLTLATAAINGEAVTVAYADPTTGNDVNAIQDLAGNDAASLGATTVTNNTPASGGTTPPPTPPTAPSDTTAPVFTSAAVNGSTLVMSYTDANNLDAAHAPAAGAFTVSGHAVSGVAVNASAKTVSLTLATGVVHGEAVTVAYTDPTTSNDANAIQDLAGNDAASLGATTVTNNTPVSGGTSPAPVNDTTPPTVISFNPADGATGVNPASNIVLNFSELVQKGATGTIEIHSGSANGSLVESFVAATSANLTVSGSTLTINPSNDLSNDTHYFVTLHQGSINDLAGNGNAEISTYDFITRGADPFASADSNSDSGSGAVLIGVGAAGILAWALLF